MFPVSKVLDRSRAVTSRHHKPDLFQYKSSTSKLLKISRSATCCAGELGELTLLACLSTTNLLSWWWYSVVLPGSSEAAGASGILIFLHWLHWLWATTLTHYWWQSGYWLTLLGGVSVKESLQGTPRLLPVSHLLLPLCGVSCPSSYPAWLDINYSEPQQVTASLNVKYQHYQTLTLPVSSSSINICTFMYLIKYIF